MNYYAGIGSRQTPANVLVVMEITSRSLSNLGYVLRSGGAVGADRAFEKFASKKEIFRPEDATEETIKIASYFHPAWEKCSEYARKLHGRNVKIILGNNLNSPVKFVICWTLKGKEIGGTAMGIKIARSKNIPVYNLAINEDILKVREIMRG